MASAPPPFLRAVRAVAERIPAEHHYPFHLQRLRNLDLRFRHAVTFFVGENGSGKSTLIEALADLCRFPVSGGGRSELRYDHGPEEESLLARALRPHFEAQPIDGYFLRAEFYANFASLLDARKEDHEFLGNPYARYGGRSLHERSHGEAFLAILENRFRSGLFLLDEPESALSPQRQLTLLALMWDLVQGGGAQFIIATHSPILMTYPGAQILSFDASEIEETTIENTSHYQVTRSILDRPEAYWRHITSE